MQGRRFAILIANSNYADPELSRLMAPADDAADLARVLQDPDICGFQVQICKEQPAYKLSREIERFFDDRQHDDLLLLYFSGHGIKDLDGQLYFAAADTELNRHQVRRSTAISAQFVNEIMSRSRSRRQLVLLDCCHSGAFKEGMLKKGSLDAGAIEQLQGLGRVVLTASNALQYSFEGDNVQGGGTRSFFTRALIEGLETGDADLDSDGRFSIDDIYSYICGRMKNEVMAQQPTMIALVEGAMFLGDNPRPKAAKLPDEVLQDLSNDRPRIRLSAVDDLNTVMQGSHKGRARAAYEKLASVQIYDDSLQVREAAKRYVEQVKQPLHEKSAAAEQSRYDSSVKHAEESPGLLAVTLKGLKPIRNKIIGGFIVALSIALYLFNVIRAPVAPPPSPRPVTTKETAETPPAVERFDDYLDHIKQGKFLFDKANYDGAIAEYQRANKLDPKDPVEYYLWSWALYKKQDYDGAVAKYQEAIALDPENQILDVLNQRNPPIRTDLEAAVAANRKKKH
jgi:tetratricopeptide (TPR) repeat protein